MNLNKYAIQEARFDELARSLAQRKVMVVGDVGIDRYTIGEATRLNPEAPVPIVTVVRQADKLGLAANVADNICAFGARPVLLSLIGADRYGDELRTLLAEKGIAATGILASSHRKTTLKERIIANNQQVVRVDYEGASELRAEDEELFTKSIEQAMPGVDAVIIEDYSKGVITKSLSQSVIRLAKAHGKLVAVDPPSASHPRYVEYYRGATMLTPNLQEAEKLSGVDIRSQAHVVEAGKVLLGRMEAEAVVVTQGKDGMTIITATNPPLQVPTFARAVFDVSGAGDTVISMIVLARASGARLEEAAVLANFAAGVEVGKSGTATVSIAELKDYIKQTGGLAN